MLSSKIIIHNPTGLHLRPAGMFCNLAIAFRAKVTIQNKDSIANGKSVLSVLGACIKEGDEIILSCEGEDEEEALRTLSNAIENGLGDEIPDKSKRKANNNL